MARPRSYKTEGVVIRHAPLGEADRIITLYTEDLGKVRAVAKGVRRIKSRLGGHLELLRRTSVSLAVGRSLDVVTEAQVLESFRGFSEDLERLATVLYVVELVDGFTPERSPNHPVYRLLLDTLRWLEKTDRGDLLARFFELHLLEHSGYMPELFRCIECRSMLQPGDHYFSCANGGVRCPQCRVGAAEATIPVSLAAMKVLRFLARSNRFTDAEALELSAGVLAETERLLRTYIRFVVEKEFKSAEFMNLVSSGRGTTLP